MFLAFPAHHHVWWYRRAPSGKLDCVSWIKPLFITVSKKPLFNSGQQWKFESWCPKAVAGLKHLRPCMPCAPRALPAASVLFTEGQEIQLIFNTNVLGPVPGYTVCRSGECCGCSGVFPTRQWELLCTAGGPGLSASAPFLAQ